MSVAEFTRHVFTLKMNWGRAALIVSGGLLALGVASSLVPRKPVYFFKPDKALRDCLRGSGDGWRAEDHPLGETEYQDARAKEILHLDDFVFRSYQRGGTEFSVYCAFWKPGAQTLEDAGTHNPDKCWVQAGWKADSTGNVRRLELSGRRTWPGEDRRFVNNGRVQYVIFWHIIGGRPSGYSMGEQRNWRKRGPFLLGLLLANRGGLYDFEQYFVRVSSSTPIEKLMEDSFFIGVMEQVARVGLMARE